MPSFFHRKHSTPLRWLAEEAAAEKVLNLAPVLHEKIQRKFEENRGTLLVSYSPWLDVLPEGTELPRLPHDSEVLTQPEVLESIAAFLDPSEVLRPQPAYVDTRVEAERPWFRERYQIAKEELFQCLPWIRPLYNGLIFAVVPVCNPTLGTQGRYGLSHHRTKGAMYFQYPKEQAQADPQNVIDLCHEVGHQILMVYLSADPLITSSPDVLVYSGARGEARTAYRSLHSAMALAYMAMASGALAQRQVPSESYLGEMERTYAVQLAKNVLDLQKKCTFSQLGRHLMRELGAVAETHAPN